MNDPRIYQPTMTSTNPGRGMGKSSEVTAAVPDRSARIPREHLRSHLPRRGSRLVGGRIEPQPKQLAAFVWSPPSCTDWGYAFHGMRYARDLCRPGATHHDGVELLQFAEYRDFAGGLYHVLMPGFRFPAVGASDTPTVARSATAGLTF